MIRDIPAAMRGVALAGLGLALAGCGVAGTRTQDESANAQAAAREQLVTPITVRAENTGAYNILSGQVEPERAATVAAEAPGRITARPVEQGGFVKQGQVLAVLDSADAAIALDQAAAAREKAAAGRRQVESEYARALVETDATRRQARAQLKQAEAGKEKLDWYVRARELKNTESALTETHAAEDLAKIEVDRCAKLVAEGALEQRVLDQAKTALEVAGAKRHAAELAVEYALEGAVPADLESASQQIDVAKAGVKIAGTRNSRLAALRAQIDGRRAEEAAAQAGVRQAGLALGKHEIRAPFAGRVLATYAEVGDLAAPDTRIARIGSIARVKVTFAVPESSRAGLHIGRPVAILADALPGRVFTGHIATLGFEADPRTRTFPIEVLVENPDEALLPNMLARLKLPVGRAGRGVTVPVDSVATDGTAEYVYVIDSGKAVRREVALGAPLDGRVVIKHGLKAGEIIAATPQRLIDGAAVRAAP